MNIRAAWNNDGRGWMLKISSGFSPAKLNREDLPAYGDFTLVELVMKHTEEGIRLDALEIYKLASRFAMPKLQRGDDDICESITDRGTLSREQKASVYQIFKTLFMREVWGDSRDVGRVSVECRLPFPHQPRYGSAEGVEDCFSLAATLAVASLGSIFVKRNSRGQAPPLTCLCSATSLV